MMRLLCVPVAAVIALGLTAQDQVTVFRGATILPADGPAIEQGVLFIAGGRSQLVGGPDTRSCRLQHSRGQVGCEDLDRPARQMMQKRHRQRVGLFSRRATGAPGADLPYAPARVTLLLPSR